MLEKQEKVYIIILVTSVITLIFSTLFITFHCPKCDVFSSDRNINRPVIVYKL